MPPAKAQQTVSVVGGGPAGLMAAEILSRSGVVVDLFDAMPSVGRKFLMAGKGGMNITHSEPEAAFRARYGKSEKHIAPLLDTFGPEALRQWMHELGFESFVGSSGRVFPSDMKAAPLLRSWLHRLRASGVRFHMRHRWCDIEHMENDKCMLDFSTPEGKISHSADAVILALGGGSWAKFGSNGQWVKLLKQKGISVSPLKPSNCGFDTHWSDHLRERFAGQPVKSVTASFTDMTGQTHRRQGEFMITRNGVEGGLIYALSSALRDSIDANGSALLLLDLLPGHDEQRVIAEVAHPRGSRSLSSHLQSRLGLKGIKMALLHECLVREELSDPKKLASGIKSLPLRLIAPRPLDEAISSAGGVRFQELDEHLMIRSQPGVFCAGEMLDWEAPTGGYLLTACFASGVVGGNGALNWLKRV